MPTFVRWNVVSVCMCVGGLLRSPSIGKRQVLPGRFGEGRRCAGVGRIISGSRTRRSTYSRTRDHHHHDDRQRWRWRRWRLPLASAAGPGDRPWSQSLPVWRPHCWNASSKIDSVATNASDGDMELVDRDKTKKNGADPSATNTSEIDRPRRTYAIKSIRKIMSSSCRIHVNVFVRNYIVRGVFFFFFFVIFLSFARIASTSSVYARWWFCSRSNFYVIHHWPLHWSYDEFWNRTHIPMKSIALEKYSAAQGIMEQLQNTYFTHRPQTILFFSRPSSILNSVIYGSGRMSPHVRPLEPPADCALANRNGHKGRVR